MNLREILVAERDKSQATAQKLQQLVQSIDTLIAHWDAMAPPGSERQANAVPVTVFHKEEKIGGEPMPAANTDAPEDTMAGQQATAPSGELTVKVASERYGVRANVIANWKKWGRVTGSDGHVNEASLLAQMEERGVKRGLQEEKSAPIAEDEITNAEAAALVGTTSNNLLKNQVYKGQVTKTRTGYVSRASVEAYIAQRDANPTAVSAIRRHQRNRGEQGALPEGYIMVADAAQRLGCSTSNIYLLKNQGKLVAHELGYIQEESLIAHQRAKAAPRPVKEKLEFDDPRPIVKDLPAPGPWNPQQTVNDRYVSMEKACVELNCNMDWLRTVKKSGRIYGAPDWLNMTQMEAYLKHPDFDAPLIKREPGTREKLTSHHY